MSVYLSICYLIANLRSPTTPPNEETLSPMSVEASTPYIFPPTVSVEFNKLMNSTSLSFSKIELD